MPPLRAIVELPGPATQRLAEAAARDEWRRAPSDDALLTAHVTARGCARDYIVARDRRLHAQARFEESGLAVKAVRRDLVDIATDLQLPETVDSLLTVEVELDRFSRSALTLTQAASDVRSIWPERHDASLGGGFTPASRSKPSSQHYKSKSRATTLKTSLKKVQGSARG